MTVLESLRPAGKPRVMDLVQEAGIDVSDWVNIKSGWKNAASNPKYCYEWSYYQRNKVIVLNLWFGELKERNEIIFRDINYRKMAERLTSKPSQHRRASNSDQYVLKAFEKGLPVRVIICDGIQRESDDPKSSPSNVTHRALDSASWTVSAYNKRTGQATLTRGVNKNNSSNQTRVLFARIGYMKYYKGSLSDDEKPVGGGKYNDKNTGHEIYNFKDVHGRIYGYIQPYLKQQNISSAKINLEKIEPGYSGNNIDDVLVIFFSTLPEEGGQVIVGWYKHASVHRSYQKSSNKHQRNGYGYNMEAVAKNCTLLPPNKRIHVIAGKSLPKLGRPGQANAFYIFENGTPKRQQWINNAISYVDQYEDENLLDDPETELQRYSADEAEKEYARSTGQAFNSSVKSRKAIEEYSMSKAKLYFEKILGYIFVRDTSSNHSYDLEFIKNGKKLFVEVKGTQTDGKSVFLTSNEVKHVNKTNNSCALYILHSINIKETKTKCTCTGGKEKVTQPWSISDKDLKVITYQYKVPG